MTTNPVNENCGEECLSDAFKILRKFINCESMTHGDEFIKGICPLSHDSKKAINVPFIILLL